MKDNYKRYNLTDILKIEKLVTIYYNEFSNDAVFTGESHNFWELVYADKGTAIVTAEKEQFVLTQGSIVFHKPNEFHAIRSVNNDPPNVVVITFTVSKDTDMSFFCNRTAFLPEALRFHITEVLENAKRTFVIPMTGGVLTLAESPVIGGEQMIKTHLEQMLIELMRQANENAFSTNKAIENNTTVGECIAYLSENIYGNVTIDAVCARTNYSRTYICTLFRAVTGKTIIQYYNELKIDEAKKLIRKNKNTFAEISELLGFNTPTYFSHIFSKITNMTPSQYKKSVYK